MKFKQIYFLYSNLHKNTSIRFFKKKLLHKYLFEIPLWCEVDSITYYFLISSINLKAVYLNFNQFNDSWTLGFELVTCGFELVTYGFKLVTPGFELATCGFELVTRRFELVARGFELVTCAFELVTRGFELLLLIFQLVTRNS